MSGKFNIIGPAYKYGRLIGECLILLLSYASLIITYADILSKIHLLWLWPVSWLIGSIIGGCITRIITNVTDRVEEPSIIEKDE